MVGFEQTIQLAPSQYKMRLSAVAFILASFIALVIAAPAECVPECTLLCLHDADDVSFLRVVKRTTTADEPGATPDNQRPVRHSA